ncbi:ATP-binding protein [Marmoricola sp. RAF53]|uniref:ATP-binding protein n=1 Tax=Marmoricola sp. RAF53 TaxID=3233059 RepID=UPI003F95BB9A
MGRTGGPRATAFLAALLLCASTAAGVLGIAITDSDHPTAAWWPAAGIGVLTLLLLPRSWWPGLLAGLFGTYVLANLIGDRPLDAAVLLAMADTAETAVVSWAVLNRVGRRMETVGEFGWLLGISFGGAVLAALGVAATSAQLLGGEFSDTVAATTAAHWAAVMLIVPLGLVPRERLRERLGERLGGPDHRPSPWLLVLQLALLLTATVLAFGPGHHPTLGFAPLPFLIWAGVAFGPFVVAVEQLALAVLVTALTLGGWGPFADSEQAANQVAQLYLLSLVIAGTPLALAVRQQRRATVAVWAEKKRTEAIIESSSMPILVTDEDGVMLSANPAVTELTGFRPADLIGRPFWERLMPAGEWELAQERFAEARVRGRGVIRTAAGGERIVTYSQSELIDPVDGTVHYVLTAADITAERASTHFLQHLLRSATTVAILGTDEQGVITLVNAGAERMLRIDQATGRDFLDFLDPDEVARRGAEYEAEEGFGTLVHDVAADGVPQTRDWTWVPPDGVPLRVSMTTSLVADARQRPIGYLFVARDVTDTRRNQELLHQALERERAAVGHLQALDHAKDDFVSTVSHELRTPLTSIIGSIELLGDGLLGELGPDQKHLIDVIERNAERLLALANDLLLLSAYEGAGAQPLLVPLDLRTVVTASEASIVPLLNHRDLEMQVDLPDDPVPVLGDVDYLERAVTNLLTNAVKFTQDGGSVTTTVLTDPANRRCSLSVADSGIGIPEEDLASVFQRFFRSRNVRADAIQGTGLGLSIVRSVVEAHHGSIEVHSQPGAGTTFTIHLPMA